MASRHIKETSEERTPVSTHARGANHLTIIAMVATALVVLMQLYVSIPLKAAVAKDLGAASATTALASGFSLFYALGFLVYGPLSDHVGRRKILLAGLIVLILTTTTVGFSTSFFTLLILRSAQGAAAATFPPVALAYLGESLKPKQRAGAIGAMSVSFLAAGIIGQLYALWIARITSWHWVFFISSAALIMLTVLIALVIVEPPIERRQGKLVARYAKLLRFTILPILALWSFC